MLLIVVGCRIPFNDVPCPGYVWYQYFFLEVVVSISVGWCDSVWSSMLPVYIFGVLGWLYIESVALPLRIGACS